MSKHPIQAVKVENEKAGAGWTDEPVSRDQILRCEREQVTSNYPCSADYEQDWQSYTVDPYSDIWCRYFLPSGRRLHVFDTAPHNTCTTYLGVS